MSHRKALAVFALFALFCAPAHASEHAACGLQDAKAFYDELNDPSDEATPAYIRGVAEAFIERCAGRPEVVDAHLIAARAATDGREPATAIAHYETAISRRAPLAFRDRLNLAAAYAAAGRAIDATAEKEAAVEDWLQQMERFGAGVWTQETTSQGRIYRFDVVWPDPERRQRAVWLAVPHGPAWPAAVTLGSDRQRSAFYQLRQGPAAGELMHLDFDQCDDQRTLLRTEDALTADAVEPGAELVLKAYLAAPNQMSQDGAFEVCDRASKLLPSLGG
ncbi:MAG: hypothetical protein AAFX03_13620 [Pseudomonadota bacterium]